jgi:hypothetical protein
MKVAPDEMALAGTLARRLCTVALQHDAETFRAFAVTAISMALARHRRRHARLRQERDAAFV